MTESYIKYLSHKIKRKNKWSDGENHIVAVFEAKKSKNKDISNGENLFEAPANEVLGSLPSYFQDRSSVLIEPTQLINLGSEESPKIIHVAQSLSAEEKEQFNFLRIKRSILHGHTQTWLDLTHISSCIICLFLLVLNLSNKN